MGNHWPGQHTQESVCTNDCFASFKYTHEFVTNYDFDEFILPRKFLPTLDLTFAYRNLACKSSQLAALNQNDYNLYKYITETIGQATNSINKKVAAFHFEHMLLIDKMPDSFLKDLSAQHDNKARQLTFDYNNMRISFIVDPLKDSSMIYSMDNLSQLIECLNSFINVTKVDLNWNRLHGIWMDGRKGKSVFNTNYTEYITQHLAFQTNDKNAALIDVPVDFGFVSHFRQPIDNQFFFDQTYHFYQHYRLDIELYYFLAAFFQDTY